MESLSKRIIPFKAESFPVASLFLKWYLCRATLERNKKIKELLDEMDEGRVEDPKKWAHLLRLFVLGSAYPALSELLERQLSPNEVVHLFDRVEEFVQLYAMGLRA